MRGPGRQTDKVSAEVYTALPKRFPFNGRKKMNREIKSGDDVFKMTKITLYLLIEIILWKEKQIVKERGELLSCG